jgi:hypothetical protein
MNGHDPYAYLKDVLTRLPTQRTREIGPLLPVATGSYGSFEALRNWQKTAKSNRPKSLTLAV